MNRTGLMSLFTAALVCLSLSHVAAAQATPRIKAGLWQIKVERTEDSKVMPDASARMQEHMKTMTPERRKQFEEIMKQQGVDMGAGNAMKICYSQKMVDRGSWSDQTTCKTEYSNRSASAWKWHSSCPTVNYEGDGEASFPDSENFTVKSSGVITTSGKAHTSRSVRTGKWLSADCGEIKPLDSTP
jgi:hypothetical protein